MMPIDLSHAKYYPVYCNDTQCVWGWKGKEPILIGMVGLCLRKTVNPWPFTPPKLPQRGWSCLYFHPKEILTKSTTLTRM